MWAFDCNGLRIRINHENSRAIFDKHFTGTVLGLLHDRCAKVGIAVSAFSFVII